MIIKHLDLLDIVILEGIAEFLMLRMRQVVIPCLDNLKRHQIDVSDPWSFILRTVVDTLLKGGATRNLLFQSAKVICDLPDLLLACPAAAPSNDAVAYGIVLCLTGLW